MTAFTTAMPTIAALAAAGQRLIAANQSHADALAQAQADLANADATITNALQPVLDSFNAAAPAPVADDTADASGNADSGVTGDGALTGDTGTADAPVA